LTRLSRVDPFFQIRQDQAKAPTDSSVSPNKGTFGIRQAEVDFRKPFLIDTPLLDQDVAQGQGLLGVVGVEPRKPPAIWLSLPGLNPVDIILDAIVMSFNLLGRQAFKRGAESVSHGQAQETTSDTVDSGQLRHLAKLLGCRIACREIRRQPYLVRSIEKITADGDHANGNLPPNFVGEV
jgi:hypothetical protein